MDQLLYILACLLLPITWGIAVNWIFNRWERQALDRNSSNSQDYQI